MKVDQQVKNSTPFMAEHLEETLNAVTSNRQLKKDGDMTAFNKLVSTMKASGTLPSQPKVSVSIWHKPQPFLLFLYIVDTQVLQFLLINMLHIPSELCHMNSLFPSPQNVYTIYLSRGWFLFWPNISYTFPEDFLLL